MATQNVYGCDNEKCEEMTRKPKGTRYPPQWLKFTVTPPDSETSKTGSFHDIACALAWSADLFDATVVVGGKAVTNEVDAAAGGKPAK